MNLEHRNVAVAAMRRYVDLAKFQITEQEASGAEIKADKRVDSKRDDKNEAPDSGSVASKSRLTRA